MGKLKTRKATLKRFKITGRGKIMHRPVHQDHFNAKASGNQKRRKHGHQMVKSVDSKKLKKEMRNI